ncbi:ABC transporter ATP-binding protein [Lactobacillus xylocopicola]|uniref:ABC transporter ATP-binding protein n=1 Tax=Lactobacillus xylocopicola TaxID=2976676 RepID=A0ABM8BF12_9LACO|nr:ABC transporter ATP-binding protein [Lactobacillus xylocopicola]BDR59783.1 ABC transporter ATP-binding protein [Lactobacillus xylocopicola]
MLQVEHLSKNFGAVHALQDVNFTIQPGQIMGLIGQNGAGKTTTFHSILNFLHYAGQITWEDAPITESTFNSIGYLPEERSLMPKMTIEEQIVYLAQLKGCRGKEIRGQIDSWLERFEVKGKKSDKIKTLSKGNQQKVQLICTLIHQPKLIILDEPFSGLDPVNTDVLKRTIAEVKDQQAAIIFSSHDMTNVEEICDTLTMLKDGQVVLNGDLETVRDSFGKTEIYVKTAKTRAELAELPHVQAVEQQQANRYLLRLDDEAKGAEVFQAVTEGQYIEEFRQQPPTLDEIFRMKAGEKNE